MLNLRAYGLRETRKIGAGFMHNLSGKMIKATSKPTEKCKNPCCKSQTSSKYCAYCQVVIDAFNRDIEACLYIANTFRDALMLEEKDKNGNNKRDL
jgi:hypothetical protein